MRFSVSSYSYSQKISKGEMTQFDTIRKAHEMGFEGIEFTDLKPCEDPTLEQQLAYAKELRAEADKYGMEIVAYTIGANLYHRTEEGSAAEVKRLKGQLDVAFALGAKLMRHDVCYSEKHDGVTVSFAQMLPTIAKNAREITEYAQTLGIRTCTENHGFIAQDSDRVELLFNTVAHENYGILIDVGNFACADEDSAKAVSRLAPYAFHVHAKDFYVYPFGTEVTSDYYKIRTRGCNTLIACSVGEGNIPVAQCVAILKRVGYDGWFSIEYEGGADCIEGIAKGLEYLKTL